MSGIAFFIAYTSFGPTSAIDPVPSIQIAVFEFAFLMFVCTFLKRLKE
jgi:hypothetical protein